MGGDGVAHLYRRGVSINSVAIEHTSLQISRPFCHNALFRGAQDVTHDPDDLDWFCLLFSFVSQHGGFTEGCYLRGYNTAVGPVVPV